MSFRNAGGNPRPGHVHSARRSLFAGRRVPVGGAVHHGGRRSNLGTHSSAQLTTEEMTIASCTAQVLHADKAVLERLRADPVIEFIDHLDEQREELRSLRPPPDAALVAEPCRWAYYPRRRTVTAVLGPRAFRAVRLDRNRNLITADEQTRLGALRIGVAGLSVGHVIAHTLAAEGLCGALDDLVTAAAAELMAATAGNSATISQRVLADLVSHLGVDVGFLRHNDHAIHATVLIAEWPAPENVPDPDPIGVVYFADADSVFTMAENLKEPFVVRPEPANDDYQRLVEEGRAIPQNSLACVPLLSGDVTTGILGFVKVGDREWLPEELNALQAIATLFAQLQARIVAEEQLHYLAEHDDLTDLLNRRALIALLDERLAAGQPGPVSLLLLDLDRLKVINDHVGHNAGDRFIKAFAELLRGAADVPSAVARFGGDEFIVVPTAPMEVEAAEAFAQWLQGRLRKQVLIDGELLARTVSI